MADNERRIVVGVDGSPSSRQALRWAVQQAELTGGSVDAVIAWRPLPPAAGFGLAPLGMADISDFSQVARDILRDAVTGTVNPASPVTVRQRVAEGHPARVLLEAADGADLLVVGSRGHGGFAGMLLGSVSQHCAHHAPCPVVIIRGDEQPR